MIIVEPSLWLFFGRLHPLVLHFPVALLILVAVLELLGRVKQRIVQHDYQSVIYIVLIFGTFSAIIAASMGYSLASSGGYQGETIYWHKRFGISVAVLAILASVFKYLTLKKNMGGFLYPYYISLSLCIAAIFTAGHHGGALTHGSEFLPSAAPEPLASFLRGGGKDESVKLNLKYDTFTQNIEPILEKHCYQCHGDNKQQGGLQLNKQNQAFSGGESGIASIKPGAALQSEIIRRLFLDRNSKKAMPPDGKPRPSADELVTLMDWIESGAPWAGESAGPRGFLADHLAKELQPTLQQSELTAIDALKAADVAVRTVNKNNPLLIVNMSLVKLQSEQIVKLLTPVKNKVTWLNLSNNYIDNKGIEFVRTLTLLTQLSLANTNINDQQLGRLSELKNLTLLNLTGNKQVTKTALENIVNLPMLQQIYLWQTDISPTEIKELSKQYPHIKFTSMTAMTDPIGKVEKNTFETNTSEGEAQ